MATQNATFTFSLPEDIDSNLLRIYSSATETGSYSLITSVVYEYGTTKYLYASLNDTLWYKIQFFNSSTSKAGPISEAVYGGTFSAASPFLAVSTTSDGANYATSQDVFDYSGLTTEDVPQSRVSAALRRARALIDFRTSEMDVSRFQDFTTDVQRRKYNATLRLLKEAEINIALGVLYQNLCDDIIISNRRLGDDAPATGSIGIGSTGLGGDSLASRSENIAFLAALADRYFSYGNSLLSSLDTNSVRLIAEEFRNRFPKFQYPFSGWGLYRAGIGSW